MDTAATLLEIYDRLLAAFGPQHWWPGETPFEVMVGAVLTQNTNWNNVQRAIANLKEARVLEPRKLYELDLATLAGLIRPAGYYNVKAGRLRNLLQLLVEQYGGDVEQFFQQETATLRKVLLAVKGIGPETADSILLYGGNKAIFVVDAYTHRLLFRHGLISEECDYGCMQALFHDCLPVEPSLFNEYHALIVRVGKEFCKKTNPRCAQCPLQPLLPAG